MAAPANRTIVLVRFPFSDLSGSKLRPALVLAQAGKGDIVLCQITSQPYADPSAIQIDSKDVENGTLQRTSYVRPAKIFTANDAIVVREIGELRPEKFVESLDRIIALFEASK